MFNGKISAHIFFIIVCIAAIGAKIGHGQAISSVEQLNYCSNGDDNLNEIGIINNYISHYASVYSIPKRILQYIAYEQSKYIQKDVSISKSTFNKIGLMGINVKDKNAHYERMLLGDKIFNPFFSMHSDESASQFVIKVEEEIVDIERLKNDFKYNIDIACRIVLAQKWQDGAIVLPDYSNDIWGDTISHVYRESPNSHQTTIIPVEYLYEPFIGIYLNVPLFRQRHENSWSYDLMNGSCTIAEYGCFISSQAMVMNYFHQDITNPNEYNEWLNDESGYTNGCYYVAGKANEFLKSKGITTFTEYNAKLSGTPAADWKDIDDQLSIGHPAIIQVDCANKTCSHFIVIVGKNDITNDYYMNDPYNYNEQLYSYYPNKGLEFTGRAMFLYGTTVPLNEEAQCDRSSRYPVSITGWNSVLGVAGEAINRAYFYTTATDAALYENYTIWAKYRLDMSGYYQVQAFIPGKIGNRSQNTKYLIKHTDINKLPVEEEVIINQNDYYNQWVSIGKPFYFNADDLESYVRVNDNTGEDISLGRRIVFDAIRFVPNNECDYSIGQNTTGLELYAFQNAYSIAGGREKLGCPINYVQINGFVSFKNTTCHYQTFSNGSIQYHLLGAYQFRAFPIVNPLYNKWASLGFNINNPLGYPISDLSSSQISSRGTAYQFQDYEGGALEYHRSGSFNGQVFEVHGEIFSKWKTMGYASHSIGLPISDEREALASYKGTSGRVSDFENGHIHWHRDGDHSGKAFETHGPIDTIYVAAGGTGDELGFPISDQYLGNSGYPRNDFEGGYITTIDGVNYQIFYNSGSVLSVVPSNRDVTAIASTTTFAVSNTGTGTMGWTASVVSGSAWLSISSGASGTNSGTITASFTSNGSTESRTGTIRVTATGATGSPRDVTVTQAGTATQPILAVAPESRSVSSPSGTTTFSVSNTGTGTMNWTATVVSGSAWLSISSGSSGTNSGTITASFTSNGSTESRTGTIRVTATGATGSPKDVTVTQAGTATQPILAVTPDGRSVSSLSGTTTFAVSNTGTGTMGWTTSVVSGSAWLSISSGSSGTNSGTITASFISNGLAESRTGTIRVTATGATGSPKDVTVTQAGTSTQPILAVAPESRSVSSPSGTTTFAVSNTGTGTMGWTTSVVSGSAWLSISSGSSGTNSGTITASFTSNGSTESRTGTIRVTATGATGSPKDVTVTQAGVVQTGILRVTPEYWPATPSAGTATFEVVNAGSGTMNWTASVASGSSWLSIQSGSSGTNNGLITVSYSYNGEPAARTGSIIVTAAGATGSPAQLTVFQESESVEGRYLDWTQKTPMPVGKVNAACAVVDGIVYVIGGNSRFTVYAYNPVADTWTQKADLPMDGIDEGGAVSINNKIYAMGPPSNSVFSYDPAKDAWTFLSTMPNPRRGASVLAVDEKIYIIGGFDSGYSIVEEFNPFTNVWTRKTDMPTGRGFSASAAIGNEIYVYGGHVGGSWDVLEAYDTATDTWQSFSFKFDYPTPKSLASAISIHGRMYVIGGRFADASAIVDAYYPDSNAWRQKNSLLVPRIGHVSALVGGHIYVIGGSDGNNNIASVEEGIFSGGYDQYLISGNVSLDGQGLAGVIINGLPGARTDANGNYKKLVDWGWTSEAVPAKAGYSFVPSSRTHFYIREDQPGQDYTAETIVSAASITVTTPNGGEVWPGGSTQNIQWNSTGEIPNVKIEYSSDNGVNWTTIAAETANNGAFPWVLPKIASSQCLVRVVNAAAETPSDVSNAVFSITAEESPIIGLSRTAVHFGMIQNGDPTKPQSVIISNQGAGILQWTASSSSDWISVNPASGTGPGVLEIGISRTDLSPGSYEGAVTISSQGASNSPQIINVSLKIMAEDSSSVPFGSFDTPLNNAAVMSSIPVTGWALDDVQVESVKIYRNPVGAENPPNGRVFIGDGTFVEGTRPDVEKIYPNSPLNYRAGWGYMLLTNFMPGGGNGTFTLYAYATDKEGHEVLIGSKTITCDNLHAVKPFGAIDTPTQGGEISGALYYNFGWALTPMPNKIPTDGSTLGVWIDGQLVGRPRYNNFRDDIAALFPGYANSQGAVGVFDLDTTAYENGMHNIAWSVRDDAGNEDGIGSRFFWILNIGNPEATPQRGRLKVLSDLEGYTDVSSSPTMFRKGYDRNAAPRKLAATSGQELRLQIREVERMEIAFGEAAGKRRSDQNPETGGDISNWEGYLVFGEELRSLPIGSTLNSSAGIFSWLPGPGFLGDYRLVFVERSNHVRRNLTVRIVPRS